MTLAKHGHTVEGGQQGEGDGLGGKDPPATSQGCHLEVPILPGKERYSPLDGEAE